MSQYILHLSDLHIDDAGQADTYRTRLESDLKQELKIEKLDYLVISGDFSNTSVESEYSVAAEMIEKIITEFRLDKSRVVIVPGNHDLNWDLADESYTPKRTPPSGIFQDKVVSLGDKGYLVRDEEKYKKRFDHFNSYLYSQILKGESYPSDYADQILFVENPEDRILFLGFNSSWNIDPYFPDRSGINPEALNRAIDRVKDKVYDGWLKIAVFHHPVSGLEMMNDVFMQILAVHNFQIVLHGHIHTPNEGYYKYDTRRGIHIIGAGCFGKPTRIQDNPTPLQYNIIQYDTEQEQITVHTRKRDDHLGAWMADSRWSDKNHPDPYYHINLGQVKKKI
ncbi:metallophosphoesterase family protein [Methanospirillum lacunae]|uniref:Calcineurin-like phosphoesterase domain-containing protein n=1 Tax=Methanospirillum lacunae TaxID=668570 RepID=A0A2V2N1N1_9EURY|nr:metallophosphoesterase [Methanospirillum lacunae]PWR70428.1 hypothetical protein DK846_14795 [Methanospirillum lacunae]